MAESTTKERKRTNLGIVKKGDFVVLVDSRWFPCGDVNMELDSEKSAIAVVLEDRQYNTSHGGLETKDFKHFTVRRHYKNPAAKQKCYDHNSIRQLIHDYNERMKPDPGMSKAQQQAIWLGVKAFEEQYKGE